MRLTVVNQLTKFYPYCTVSFWQLPTLQQKEEPLLYPGLSILQNLAGVLMSGAFYNVSQKIPPCLACVSLL